MNWHGYPQHPDADAARPWWRVTATSHPIRTDGTIAVVRLGETITQSMQRTDKDSPLPAPPPLCGQVWVWPSYGGCSSMIHEVATNDKSAEQWRAHVGSKSRYVSTNPDIVYDPWPFRDAVLVAGPGSPWAPPEAP